jgi:hypothetical protein
MTGTIAIGSDTQVIERIMFRLRRRRIDVQVTKEKDRCSGYEGAKPKTRVERCDLTLQIGRNTLDKPVRCLYIPVGLHGQCQVPN